jgi:hypothetical protein
MVTERMLRSPSLTSSLWTNIRNSLQLGTVKFLIVLKTHFKDVTCSEFFDLSCKDKNFYVQETCNMKKKEFPEAKIGEAAGASDKLATS